MAGYSSGRVTRRSFVAAAGATGALALAGCQRNPHAAGQTGGSDLTGQVVVTGSSTVFPITDLFSELFMEEHPEVNVTADSTGTGGGFENHFCPGNSDVNGASRPIKDAEMQNCRSNGVEPVEFQIASDALTVAVNNDADWVDCISLDELSQIWRKGGAQRWSDVREEWPDEEFDLYGPASTSGTYDWFAEHVVGEDHTHTAQHEPTEEDNLIVQGIQDSKYAMGYFGFAYYSENQSLVKALNVETEDGGCTEPNLENAKSGSYPLARPLFIYASEEAARREAVSAFLEFYLENAATEYVSDIGYVPTREDQRDDNLDKLDEMTGASTNSMRTNGGRR